MSRLIIALGGLKRSGKDTFAGILASVARSRPNLTPHCIAFAEPLRRAAAAAYNTFLSDFSDDSLKDTIDPTWGITRRQMLINVGEAMRGVDADHWTKLLTRRVDDIEKAARQSPTQRPLHIVTDLRRPNEAKALLDLGATLVLVVRDGVVWDGHETEAMAGMATIRWHHGRRAARLGFPPPATDPYHLVVENAYPVDGDASMIPAATAAFEKVANQLIDAVLSTARG